MIVLKNIPPIDACCAMFPDAPKKPEGPSLCAIAQLKKKSLWAFASWCLCGKTDTIPLGNDCINALSELRLKVVLYLNAIAKNVDTQRKIAWV
jgi:hypothetical protein